MNIGTRLFGYTETDLDVAAILEPSPSTCSDDNDEHGDWISRLEEQATSVQITTREHVSNNGDDPLLLELERLRRQRNEIEQQMILLVAYMREKVKPRPYTLQQIADAAGLSVSGTRTFYDADDVQGLDQRIQTAKQAVSDEHARGGTTPGTPSLPLDAARTDPSQPINPDGTLPRVALRSDGDV